MALRESVTVTFGADIAPFRRALASISSSMTGLKQEMAGFGGGKFANLLGIGAIIRAFQDVYNWAQKARDEAEKFGLALSPAVAMTAQIADGWDEFWQTQKRRGAEFLGWFGQLGSKIGQAMGTASSPEDIASLRRAEGTPESNAADAKRQEDMRLKLVEKIARAKEAANKAEQEARRANLTIMERAEVLQREGNAIAEEMNNTLVGSLKYEELRLKHAENLNAMHKNGVEIQREDLKLRQARLNLVQAEANMLQQKQDMFLPGLHELAGSRGPGSSAAGQAERWEAMAIKRSGSAPMESARFAAKALAIRQGLGGRIKSGDSQPFGAQLRALEQIRREVANVAAALGMVPISADGSGGDSGGGGGFSLRSGRSAAAIAAGVGPYHGVVD